MPTAPPAPKTPPAPPERPVGSVPDTAYASKAAERFASKMTDAPKGAEKPPEPVVVLPPTPTPPEPPKAPEAKSNEPKTLVPKLEPIQDKKPEPAKAPEVKPDDSKKIPRENFKILEQARDEFRTKYESAEKRAKDLEQKLAEQFGRKSPEHEAAEKALAEYKERESKYFLEHSPEFQQAFNSRIETAILDAKEAVGAKSASRLEAILRAPPGEWRNEQLKQFASELETDFERVALHDAYSKLRQAQRERDAELNKSGENWKALQQIEQQRKQQAAERSKQEREQLYQQSLKGATEGLLAFRESEDATHNSEVIENRDLLRSFITEDMAPEEFGRMAAWAVHGYRSLGKEKALTEKVAALEAEIAKLSAVSPELDGGGPTTDKPDRADTPEKAAKKFMDRYEGRT